MSRELLSRPWAMHKPAFAELANRAARADLSAPDAFFLLLGRPGDQEESDLDVRDGVAVIRVRGSLIREPYYDSRRSREYCYTGIWTRIEEALGRGDVKSIVLDIDSPGGMAQGLTELSDRIYAARREKRIEAVVQSMGASAAYFIASAASAVYVNRDSAVGSIGSILTLFDWSKYDARVGIEEISIVSSQSPKKDPDPNTSEGRAQLQAYVDSYGEIFVRSVARNRGASVETVLSDFGQGDVMVGEAAVVAGLVDGVATLGAVVAARAADQPVKFERPLPAAGGRG